MIQSSAALIGCRAFLFDTQLSFSFYRFAASSRFPTIMTEYMDLILPLYHMIMQNIYFAQAESLPSAHIYCL